MASLAYKKILKIAAIFFIALFVLTFIIEFLYPLLKSGSVDIAFSKWIANFSTLRWVLWIVFSLVYGFYQTNRENKRVRRKQ